MKKYLSAYGNTWQLYISKPIAQIMGITQDEYTVNLTIENKVLYVKKSLIMSLKNIKIYCVKN